MRFSYEDRLTMLVAALELCSECRRDLTAFASARGMDLFTLIREAIWNWYGQWPHGDGCPTSRASGGMAPDASDRPRNDSSVQEGVLPQETGAVPEESSQEQLTLFDVAGLEDKGLTPALPL